MTREYPICGGDVKMVTEASKKVLESFDGRGFLLVG
jgi:hypothetical protein